MRIAHEAPLDIIKRVSESTDYDYALVHLFEEDKEYLEQFKKAASKGREIILDNSIFELEEAFDAEKFKYWVDDLRPSWYIVPDVLEDAEGTINKMSDWNRKYFNVPGKKIGVVQGKTYNEIVDCYSYMNLVAKVDMKNE